jgi:hypothetical protein
MVVALIALFAALGGGYALAFSGSGTLQKGALDVDTSANFQTVRTLTGIGSIDARCQDDPDDNMEIRFRNTSGEGLFIATYQQEEDVFARVSVIHTGAQTQSVATTTRETFHFQIAPNIPNDKRPMAQGFVDASNGDPNCGDGSVHAFALNTEQ